MRCPGARRAPTVSSCAWRHTRAENSGAKGSRRVIISTGRVIMRNLLLTGGASIILPFSPPANGQSLAQASTLCPNIDIMLPHRRDVDRSGSPRLRYERVERLLTRAPHLSL